jgi:hypothetical protein
MGVEHGVSKVFGLEERREGADRAAGDKSVGRRMRFGVVDVGVAKLNVLYFWHYLTYFNQWEPKN